MSITPFNFHHLADFRPRAINLLGMSGPLGTFLAQAVKTGPFYTLLDEGGRPAAIGGVMLAGDGMGEAFVYAAPWADVHPLAYVRAVKATLGQIMDANDLHRVGAMVAQSGTSPGQERRLQTFATLLGFRRVGLMRAVGRRRMDFHAYELVRE